MKNRKLDKNHRHIGFRGILNIEFLILLVVFLVSLCIGRYTINPGDALKLFSFSSSNEDYFVLFWMIRLPRAVIVLISGAALALSGTVYQSLFRNPLVSSDILGVTSGASLGAVISIILWNDSSGMSQTAAFCGGILAVGLSMSIARVIKSNSTLVLILAGIIISSMASSMVMLLKYFADPYKQLPAIEYWMMGGFYNSDWHSVLSILPSVVLAAVVIFMLRWQLKVLTLGDDEAMSLGVRVRLVRGILSVAATILVSAVVSAAGMVSWVSLVAPHIVRMITGDNSTGNLAASLGVGAVMLLAADTVARTVTASEIPVSIITSFIGAPFLGYLLWKTGKAYE